MPAYDDHIPRSKTSAAMLQASGPLHEKLTWCLTSLWDLQILTRIQIIPDLMNLAIQDNVIGRKLGEKLSISKAEINSFFVTEIASNRSTVFIALKQLLTKLFCVAPRDL